MDAMTPAPRAPPDRRHGVAPQADEPSPRPTPHGRSCTAVPHALRQPRHARPRERRDQGQRPAPGQPGRDQIGCAPSTRWRRTTPMLATEVIIGDGRLNEAQRLITALVARTIATQQPVARDLRFLLALDHVAYDLERMGDHASSVAKQARKLAPHADAARIRRPAARWADWRPQMVRGRAAGAGGRRRRASARGGGPRRRDRRLYHATFAEMLELMRADPDNVDRGARVLFAAHYLERIGDRVTNIAEDVVFLATGETEDLNP